MFLEGGFDGVAKHCCDRRGDVARFSELLHNCGKVRRKSRKLRFDSPRDDLVVDPRDELRTTPTRHDSEAYPATAGWTWLVRHIDLVQPRRNRLRLCQALSARRDDAGDATSAVRLQRDVARWSRESHRKPPKKGIVDTNRTLLRGCVSLERDGGRNYKDVARARPVCTAHSLISSACHVVVELTTAQPTAEQAVARSRKHRKPVSLRAVEFHGTKRERAIYDRVLARNTLDRELIEHYEANARYFRNRLASGGRSKDFHGASLRKSVLFGSRFLCVYLPDDRIGFPGHDYDAFCRAKWWTFPFPVICLPKSRVRDQSMRFRSVVEHEMVHATQGLAKRLPSLMSEGDDFAALLGTPQERRVLSIDECTDEVCTHAIAEFEAYFLQLGRWPDQEEMPSPGLITDFALFKWSFARAWVDALNRLLMGAYCGADILSAVLDGLHRRMPSLLLSLDASHEDAKWFTDDQNRLVASVARGTETAGGPPALREVALAWASSVPISSQCS